MTKIEEEAQLPEPILYDSTKAQTIITDLLLASLSIFQQGLAVVLVVTRCQNVLCHIDLMDEVRR